MMRRSRTQISVWTSVADLMTALVVMAFVLVWGACSEREQEQKDGLEAAYRIQLEEQEDSLEAKYRIQLEEQEDSLEAKYWEKLVGHPSCSGLDANDQPTAVVHVGILPDEQYSVRHSLTSDERIKLGDAADMLSGTSPKILSREDFKLFGEALKQSEGNWEEYTKCRYWAQLDERPDGVTRDDFQLRWLNEVQPYLGGAVNPGVLRK